MPGAILAMAMLFSLGCKDKGADGDNPELSEGADSAQQAPEFPVFSTEISTLSDSDLQKLGARNSLPTEYVFPGAFMAQAIFPEKIAAVENGADVLDFIASGSLQIPVENLLQQANLVLTSRAYTFETLRDAKTDAVMQEGFPSSSEAIYLLASKPWDKEAISNELFRDVDDSKLSTKKYGEIEARIFANDLVMPFDQSGQTVGKIEKVGAALAFPTENTAVLLSGAISSFDKYFSNLPGDKRGIAAQRLGRVNTDSFSVASQYEYDFDVPNAQLVQTPVQLTPELMESARANVSSFLLCFAGSDKDANLITLTIETKSEAGAADVRKCVGSGIMQIADSLKTALGQAQDSDGARMLASFVDVLKAVKIETNGAQVVASVENTEENRNFVLNSVKNANDGRKNSLVAMKYKGAQQALQQFGTAFTQYARENKTFPADIRDADGKPLLSWRVALLPIFGAKYKALYEQFKLDEPWNSENNIKLLDQIPPLYQCFTDGAEKTKTRFLIFNAPGTPFGKAKSGLRLQDVEDPYNTISVFYSVPEMAVEWTQPEEAVFNPKKPSDAFGEFACALTMQGEVVFVACDDSEKSAKTLATLIYGPQSEDSAEAEEKQEKNEDASAQEKTAEEKADETEQAAEATAEKAEESAPATENAESSASAEAEPATDEAPAEAAPADATE